MKHGLEIKLANYFLLIMVAAMMIGIEFYFELNRADLLTDICTPSDGNTSLEINRLRNKIVIMSGVLLVVIAIVLTMFIKNITGPLQHLVDVSRRINSGDLNQTVDMETRDEIGQLGIALNESSRNFKELAVFTATTSRRIDEQIASVAETVTDPGIVDQLEDVRSELEILRAFADLFETGGDGATQ